MRVTNEQIRAKIICTQGDTCEGCPFYGVDNCDNLRGNDFDMYKDILEDRETIEKQGEIINEMREALNGFRAGNCFCECGIDNPMMNGRHTKNCIQANAILEKTKDYA